MDQSEEGPAVQTAADLPGQPAAPTEETAVPVVEPLEPVSQPGEPDNQPEEGDLSAGSLNEATRRHNLDISLLARHIGKMGQTFSFIVFDSFFWHFCSNNKNLFSYLLYYYRYPYREIF